MSRLARSACALLLAGLLSPFGALAAENSFLDSVELSGWVSGSYNYNLDGYSDGELEGANTGGEVLSHPFKPDTNSFSFDQLWFEMERPVSDRQRAGFRADITYGKSAGILSGDNAAGSGNDLEVYQAYVQYLGAGDITWQAGKFATLIGAEVVQAPSNFNISRGQVYNLFQPITHTGVLASGSAGGFDLSLGVVNGTRNFPATDVDDNTDKAVLFAIGYSVTDTISVSLAGTHGEVSIGGFEYSTGTESFDPDDDTTRLTRDVDGTDVDLWELTTVSLPALGSKETILDLIVSFDPTDDLSIYLNADYIKSEDASIACMSAPATMADPAVLATCQRIDMDGFGVALAGRLAVADGTGISLRAEYVDIDNFFGGDSGGGDFADTTGFSTATAASALEMITLTATVDHELAPGLTLRGELRYDGIEEAGDDAGAENLFGPEDDPTDSQVVAGIELIYNF